MHASTTPAVLLAAMLATSGLLARSPRAHAGQALQTRDRAFWVSLAERDFAVPEGTEAFALLIEMNALVGSPDPVLRDRVAYGAAARWIYRERRLTPAQQLQLVELWTGNLDDGIGEVATDRIFRRSFSALNLSILAALDNEAPFLSDSAHGKLVDRAVSYFEQERDTRGYDPGRGWMHATAHAADLLKFLARSPKLDKGAQARILDAIANKCAAFGEVFRWAEEERIAQVIRSIARRPDLDRPALERWLSALPERYRELWARAPAIDPPLFTGVQNLKLVLRSTYVALSLDANPPQNAELARRLIAQTLAKMP
jgi:hypothetical protein